MPTAKKPMQEHEMKVLSTMDPEYEYLVLVIPELVGLSSFAAGEALASLKKRHLVAFEGRGKGRSVYLTDEGKAARQALITPA